MNPPIDISTLSALAQKVLDPNGPTPLRQMAARGIAPGLKPADAITVLALLSESEDEALRKTSLTTLDKLPAPLLTGALATGLSAGVLDALAPRYAQDPAAMEQLLLAANLADDTVATIATLANEAVAELVAVNEERLLRCPTIIERLYMNKATRMSTADKLIEFAARNKLELTGIPAFEEAVAAISEDSGARTTAEPSKSDLLFQQVETISSAVAIDPEVEDSHTTNSATGKEEVQTKLLPLHAALANMTVSQRIRRAMVGSSAERLLLVRDANRLVAAAVIKSPMIQDQEVLRISATKEVSPVVLGAIATSKQWIRNHRVKLNLVMNPRTPFTHASRFLTHLRVDELKNITRSREVSGPVIQAAKQMINRKQ